MKCMFITQLETLGLCLTHCVFFAIGDIICLLRGTYKRCSYFFLPIILSLQRFASDAIVKCDRKAISVKITFSTKYILFSANNFALIVLWKQWLLLTDCFWRERLHSVGEQSSFKLTKHVQIQMKQT